MPQFAPTPSTQSPTAWQRLKLAVVAGADLMGFSAAYAYSANTIGDFLKTFYAAYNALIVDLATSAGGTYIGFSGAVAYAFGTIGAAITDGPVNAMWFLTSAQRAQVKANGTTLDLTTALATAKTAAGNRPLYLPAGTWSISSFDHKLYYGGLIGDGAGVTVIKCRSAVTSLIDIDEAADVIFSPFVLKGFTLDGNSLATNGVKVRYRHNWLQQDLYVVNCVNGVQEKDTWLGRRKNVRISACTAKGLWLVGSNHGTVDIGTVITNCTSIHLHIQSSGTAADGNSGLSFTGLTVSDGAGAAVDSLATGVTFNGCYIGENIGSFVIINRGGLLRIKGGVLFFGYATGATYLMAPVAGVIDIEGAHINGQTFAGTTLLSLTTGGKWRLRDCQSAFPVGGDVSLEGDVLDYGTPAVVFAKRLGRTFTSSANNATRTELISANAITCTCATAPGPTPNITITSALTAAHPEWRDGETGYLVVVYLSNAAFNVRLSGSAFGGAPTTAIGTLPSTAGATKTYIKLDAALPANVYTILEFYRDNCAVNDFLKIEEVFFADSRMLNKGAGNVGNLFKC